MDNNRYTTIHGKNFELYYDSKAKQFVSMVINNNDGTDKINITFNGILGYSNAIVYSATMTNVDGSSKNVAVKISNMKDTMTNDKIAFLNANSDVFTKIYYSFREVYIDRPYDVRIIDRNNHNRVFSFGYDENNDEMETPIYIYVMDVVDTTLDKLIIKYYPKVLSDNTLCTLYNFLIKVIERLTVAGFYYLDIKPQNIGVFNRSSTRFVMIDVDSIVSVDDNGNFGFTPYTDGTFNSKNNLWQAQIFTALNTILVSMDDIQHPMNAVYKPTFSNELIHHMNNNNIISILNNLSQFIPRRTPSRGTAPYRSVLIAGAFTLVYNTLKNANIKISSIHSLIKFFTMSKNILQNDFTHGRIMTLMFYSIFIVLLPYPVYIKVRLLQSLVGNIVPSYIFDKRTNENISPAHYIVSYAEHILNDKCTNDRCGAVEYLLETFKIPNQSSTIHLL